MMVTIEEKVRKGGAMKNWKEEIARLGETEVERRRRLTGEISESHSPSHLRNVAGLTQKVGHLYDLTERENELAYATGWFHDVVRSSSEDPNVGDEKASANEARRILAGLVTEEEGTAIAYAIERHGRYPEWLDNAETREKPSETLEEKLHLVLFVADKLEANGVRVIARRSQFVAGDRLRSEKGDWRNFGFQPDRDEVLVVAIESFLRLAFINPEGIYPLRLRPVVGPLYQVQREFVFGVLRGLNLKIEEIARLLLETETGEGKNILQARKIVAPENIAELFNLIVSKSGIDDGGIVSVPDDVASSALETVEYFSCRYQKDLDGLVMNWSPAGEKAREWRRAMIDYMEGKPQ